MAMSERRHELQLEGLTKTLDGDIVVDDVTLRIASDERVAIVGPSGAGKTTLLRLVSGAVTPDSGTVLLNGTRLTSAAVSHAYPGSTLVDRRTALSNVLIGGSSSRSWWRGLIEPLVPRNPDRALELLDRVGIVDKADARADTLSAGERQRVAFARALLQDAPVIVADEPTANLDPSTSTTVHEVLDDAAGDRLVIAVLHDMDLAVTHYDRIVGIANGAVQFDRPAERTTVAELEGTFDRLYTKSSATHTAAENRSLGRTHASERVTGFWYDTPGHRK